MSQSGAGGVDYRGGPMASADTRRSPSGAIWSRVPWSEIKAGTIPGIAQFDDFDAAGLIPATLTTQITYPPYKIHANANTGIVQPTTFNSVETPGGFLGLLGDSDGDDASIADFSASHLMSGSNTYTQRICFEARIAVSAITTLTAGWFVGLAEVDAITLTSSSPWTQTTDATSTEGSYLGFFKAEAGTTAIQTAVNDRAAAFTAIDATAGTLAANTWTKLGLIYDVSKTAECVTFFQDGVPLATKYTSTQLAATTNLKANPLGRLITVHTSSGGAYPTLYLDWWKVSSEFNF